MLKPTSLRSRTDLLIGVLILTATGGFHAASRDAVPPTTRLARVDGQLLLILEKPGRAELTLSLAPTADGVFEIHPPAQAALSSLELDAPPPDYGIHVTQADGTSTRHDQASVISLSPGSAPLRLALVKVDETPPQGFAHGPLIIRSSSPTHRHL